MEQEKVEETINDVITIGEDAPPQTDEAPPWVKEVRNANRTLKKENRELRQKLDSGTDEKPVELGPMPTVEDADYDPALHAKKVGEWYERKEIIKNQEAEKTALQEKQNADWTKVENNYNEKKADVKVDDFDEAEETFKSDFSDFQQGVILEMADNPAVLVYALGKHPQYARELAEIKTPAKFLAAAIRLESKLNYTKGKSTPAPEGSVKGTGSLAGRKGKKSELDLLRETAKESGDYSKVVAYRRENPEEK